MEWLERVTRPVTVQYMLRDYVKILECQPLQQATNDVPITFKVYGSACFKSNENFKQAGKKAVLYIFIHLTLLSDCICRLEERKVSAAFEDTLPSEAA